MTENIFSPRTNAQTEPETEPTLRRNIEVPKGVLQKNLKTFVYLGAALLVIVAALFSSSGKKTPAQQASTKWQPPQPTLQDNTENNEQELKNQLNAKRQKEKQAKLIAGEERERTDASRFAYNLVYSRSAEQPQQQGEMMPARYDHAQRQANSSLVVPEAEGKHGDTLGGYQRPLEANVDSATGQPYLIYEGSILDTVLMNRLDGDAVGPIKVLVSIPMYSHDHQHVIIPEGTVVLGEAKKIGAAGLGQQRRMAVVFHRLIMPDGYSFDLDQFHCLHQIGDEGLKDRVNNHYLRIFGTAIAFGVVAGATEMM